MRTRTMVAAALVAAAAGVLPVGTAAAAAPYCGITWGSVPEQARDQTQAPITNLRSGRHECFDRLVVDLGPGDAPGYRVEYVPVVTSDGSGEPIPLAGGAFLSITLLAPGHDADYRPTYSPADRSHAVDVAGYTTFRQVAWAGTYEGISLVGLGVRARLPFRVLTLDGPGGGSRLVIDVAHRW